MESEISPRVMYEYWCFECPNVGQMLYQEAEDSPEGLKIAQDRIARHRAGHERERRRAVLGREDAR